MSRTLEKDVAASLSSSGADDAFKAISAALIPPMTGGLLELEILPRSHQLEAGTYVLRDGDAIGVSKLGLVQAFFVAIHVFKGYLDETACSAQVIDEDLLAATAVILLMDPEHLTAANTRKRILQARVHVSPNPDSARAMVAREKHLVDSLLTSRLHRHTKSPTLWSHRRWLVALATSLGLFCMDRALLLSDIATVVTVSGERHPRNYYAWNHARWLVGIASPTTEVNEERLTDLVKEWCIRHHTDISGWSFLHFLLRRWIQTRPVVCRHVYEEVLQLTRALRWTNESVWVFLRMVVASGLAGDGAYGEFQDVCGGLLAVAKEPKLLVSSKAWCEGFRVES